MPEPGWPPHSGSRPSEHLVLRHLPEEKPENLKAAYKTETRWQGLLGAVKMVHFRDPQDTSLVLKYFGRNCTGGEENLGNQSVGAGSLQPPGGLLEERLSGCPATAQYRAQFLVISVPGPMEPLLPPWSWEIFACIRNESRANARTPASVLHLPRVPSRVLSATLGDPRNIRTHHWPTSGFRFYQENTPQGSSEVLSLSPPVLTSEDKKGMSV